MMIQAVAAKYGLGVEGRSIAGGKNRPAPLFSSSGDVAILGLVQAGKSLYRPSQLYKMTGSVELVALGGEPPLSGATAKT